LPICGGAHRCSETQPDGISEASLESAIRGVIDAALGDSEGGYGDEEGNLEEEKRMM
jgi:hypothetical protein